MMKKIVSIILCLCLVLTPVCVFASNFPEETMIMMGDVNGDRNITAFDARKALRISAELDTQEDIDMLSIDADANGEITASDARNILRKSASLCNFSTGFDGNGVANALNTLKAKKYTIHATTEEMSFTMAIDGEDIYLETSDLSFSLTTDKTGSQVWENLGVMYLDSQLYLTFTINSKECAWQFSDEAIKMLDDSLDVDELFKIANTISDILPDVFNAPEKIEENGETLFCYKTDITGGSEFIVDTMGCLKQINDYNTNGKLTSCITVDEFSAEVSSYYFDLSRFDEIQLM